MRIYLGKKLEDGCIVPLENRRGILPLAAPCRPFCSGSHGLQRRLGVQVLQRHKNGDFDTSIENVLRQVLQQPGKAGDIALSTKEKAKEWVDGINTCLTVICTHAPAQAHGLSRCVHTP